MHRERLPKNPHLLAPGLCTVSLQSCEKYTLITQVMQSMAFYYGSPSNSRRKGIRKPPGGLSGSWPALGSSTRWQHILEGRLGVQAGLGVEADTWSLTSEMGPTFRQSQVRGSDSPHSSDPTFLLTPRASPATWLP